MCIDGTQLYDDGFLFFQLNGNAVMRLTRTAAISVCRLATDRGLHVLRVEGGIWHSPGFEARVDSIWDSKFGEINDCSIVGNNQSAESFIKGEELYIDSYILTVSNAPL